MDYDYEGKETQPDLDGIEMGIADSEMTNKSVTGCSWWEEVALLRVTFETELSVDDKEILDQIVEDNS